MDILSSTSCWKQLVLDKMFLLPLCACGRRETLTEMSERILPVENDLGLQFADGSKMDTGGDGAKSSKDSSSKQDMKSNGDIGDDRDLIVDGEDDDDKLTDGGEDDGTTGRVRVVREQERRYANNARER